MKRGFSLVELMAVLLLTGILLSSLFLFSFYFWKNHVDQIEYLRFCDQKQVFLDWLHAELRNSATLEFEAQGLKIGKNDGTNAHLKLLQNGPEFGQVAFFSEPTQVKIKSKESGQTHLKLEFTQGRWTHHADLWVQLNPVSFNRPGVSL